MYCFKRHSWTFLFRLSSERRRLVQLHLWEMEFGVRIGDGDWRRTYSDDVRIFLTYALSWRTYSGDVRILSTYVIWRRTCYGDVRIIPTYVFYQRAYLGDDTTYVLWRRTFFGTTLLEMQNSGQRCMESMENAGFRVRRTLWISRIWRRRSSWTFLGLR